MIILRFSNNQSFLPNLSPLFKTTLLHNRTHLARLLDTTRLLLNRATEQHPVPYHLPAPYLTHLLNSTRLPHHQQQQHLPYIKSKLFSLYHAFISLLCTKMELYIAYASMNKRLALEKLLIKTLLLLLLLLGYMGTCSSSYAIVMCHKCNACITNINVYATFPTCSFMFIHVQSCSFMFIM